VFGVIMQIRHPFLPKLVFRPKEVAPYVKFGIRSAATQVLYQLYTNLDYPVVLHFFGEEANGLYTIAYTIILEPVKTIANVVIDVAFPTFARLRNDRGALVKQFLAFTRLNLIAVLPFVAIVALIIPGFLAEFYRKTPAEVASIAMAARILCLVGVLRALSFIGPPLLDGLGRPELSLRYMVVAAVLVPIGFVASAEIAGGTLGYLSVAAAWAAVYPIAFLVLTYIVVRTIDLPVSTYARAAWGIVGSCAAGAAAGYGVSLALGSASHVVRMLAIAGAMLVVMLGLFAGWQGITPKSIKAGLG
jgi:O-antigen/teichoic acid export membrane protein